MAKVITNTQFGNVAEWAMKVLNVEAVLSIAENTPLLRKLSDDVCLHAALFPSAVAHNYQLITSEEANELMIIHECIHLWQFERGDLEKLPKGYAWKGKAYDNRTPYYARPWEKEAFRLEKDLYKEWEEFTKD